MIAFVSIFLGLILGPQNVELLVSDEITRVEILLDSRVVAVLEEAPWRATCNFGESLVPRELVAIAYDGKGEEVARARQGVNLSRQAVEAEWILDGEPGSHHARLIWESTAGAEPESVRISFDGRPLDLPDPLSFDLPPHDPAQLHFLRAELDFPDNITSVTETAFGGSYGAEIETEITAFPIAIRAAPDETRPKPTVASLQGVFRKAGRPLEVIAVEKGAAEVVMVLDRAFGRELETFRRRKSANHPEDSMRHLGFWRFASALEPDQRLRFVVPEAEERAGFGAHYNLFPESPTYTSADAGVYYLMSMHDLSRSGRGKQRLSDAVAVAGMIASGTRRPRAVVLVLGRKGEDASQISPEITRAYLEALRVPLYIWYPRKKLSKERASWGEKIVQVSSQAKLDTAIRRLSRDLEEQWIVWLDGVHLPQEIELAPGGQGIELVR